MVLTQRIAADENFQLVPPMLAALAAAYQRACIAEAEQLAAMGRQSLDAQWSDDVRGVVLLTRRRIHEAEEARAPLRDQVREFVITLRAAGEPAASVLRHTRSMIRLLESTRAVAADGGRFEAELLAWAAEDYQSR